ncbi:Ubiquitin family [Popillia japonica]|uniref:Ubiquitin family n=1 Tax=Popillia japonica TaxID=7064 RepID=A0AAW1JD70_POPJA
METLPVTLIVKAPNQQIEDQTVKCELSWTINKLKQHLSEVYPSNPVKVYPSNPPSHEQKLIYSGQLLSDSVVLKDVLRQYDGQDTHTVHLVCSPNSKVSPTSKKPTRTEMPTHTPEVTPTNSATEQRVPPNMQWYNHQNGDQQAIQFMMMQQAYFQYLHYMNLYYNAANQTTSQSLPPNPNQLPLAQQQIENQQADPNGAAVQQPAVQQQQQQDPERDQNRDWLDIFYTIMQGEAAQEEQTPSRLMVVWTFFTTFFASLIPEIPNVV